MDVSDLFATLPHDDWYDDYTWGYILGSEGENGAVNHGSGAYVGANLFDPRKVVETVHWHVEEGCYGPEHDACGVFRLVDGTFAVYTGWCDTTGWGCQDDARFTFHSSYGDAVAMGMGDENRRWFGLSQPAHQSASVHDRTAVPPPE